MYRYGPASIRVASLCTATSNVKYFPNIAAECQRTPIPASMRPIPIKKTEACFQDMAACGSRRESKKSDAIPIHQSTTMRFSEPRSRTFEESGDRLSLQAMIPGSTQEAHVLQKISSKIDLPKNGKGPDCRSPASLMTDNARAIVTWVLCHRSYYAARLLGWICLVFPQYPNHPALNFH